LAVPNQTSSFAGGYWLRGNTFASMGKTGPRAITGKLTSGSSAKGAMVFQRRAAFALGQPNHILFEVQFSNLVRN
jgi:hypothetical protein